MKLCFLDTETTGLENGRLVQLAYEVYDSNAKEPGIVFERKYKPPVAISIEAMATHHITEKMVADLPAFTPGELGNALSEYVLVAHNAKFDIGILKNEGIEPPKHYIDTKKVAQTLFEFDAYNLQFLRYKLGLEVEAIAHDALGDILVLKALFMHLFEEALMQKMFNNGGKEVDNDALDRQVIKEFVEISIKPLEIKRFPFGKYKGQEVAQIARQDIGYLQWLKKTTLEKPDQDEDLIYTLSLYL